MTFPLHTGDRTATVCAEWMVWDTRCRLVVTDPWALYHARDVLEERLAAVDRLVDPRRVGSRVRRMLGEGGRAEGPFGPKPTAACPSGIGPFPYGLASVPAGGLSHVPVLSRWQQPATGRRRGRDVMVVRPAASAFAWTAQRCAEAVAESALCGVLVAVGDDVATSGLAPMGGWRVELPADHDDGVPPLMALDGGAIARVNICRPGGRGGELRRVVSAAGRTVPPVWRTVTVAAANGPAASAACRGALLYGAAAPTRLANLGLAARLVAVDGSVRTVGAWPADG